MSLIIWEDNQATILCLKKGYSPKMRTIGRVFKVNMGSIKEELDKDVGREEERRASRTERESQARRASRARFALKFEAARTRSRRCSGLPL